MKNHWHFYRLIFVSVIAIMILATSACGKTSSDLVDEIPDRILFIGNSLTFYNGGLEYHIMKLANSADPPLVIQADSFTKSGAWLKILWQNSEAPELISAGNYDVVVLQDYMSPLTDVESFHKYTRLFVEEIKSAGAEPLLFMTWARELLTTEDIAKAHKDIAKELDVNVAPVGLAWERAMEERPDLDMYDTDKLHPSIHGSYLAVNVFYATIFGKSPLGLSYLPSEEGGVTEDEAKFLQHIAWETVQAYQAQE